ncbi:FKBP-type peptidyl-prolyl cis-trans isomerase [Nocardioides sp. JQ2195]|uniref:FKBP-type peptidyl-prolyl cis-trans isomerase n=1 Tax=Nocardioides sp. JQ2195 TaxID=2592334 RepID=UPI00143E23FE|nr:FKBP-type peptidyl-prolyl cis-trans isomerase [Nocardioides sp. JQ2195]QIX27340.1 FKBP-type peptidyl-prolyl cis-trans isomerase [Nocardioides sp. JQ2195]
MRTARRITSALAVTAFVLTVAAACSDDDAGSADKQSAADRVCTADDIEVDGGFGEKPEVTLPEDCTAPTEIVTKDLVEGSGPEAQEGGGVLTDYLLVSWSDQQVQDNSFDRGQPFPVEPLGQAQVIQGWNEGLIGIQKGDRRLIIIPPEKGYGTTGQGTIGPDETLVFVVDAVEIR